MVDVESLTVSLTKNGYLKIADVVAAFPRHEVLEHLRGARPGVNLVASQVANILCADPRNDMPPSCWDGIRQHDRATIRAFTFLAILFSHHRLIEAFRNAGRGAPEGTIFRDDFSEKEYTNLQFAMAEVEMCGYARGTDQVRYDMRPVTDHLRDVGALVGELFRAKLLRCGWRDPDEFPIAADLPLVEECVNQRFHEVLGLNEAEFTRWIAGRPRRPR